MSILYDERKVTRRCDHDNLPERKNPTEDAVWCGIWYDCPVCGFSKLIPSAELRTLWRELDESTN